MSQIQKILEELNLPTKIKLPPKINKSEFQKKCYFYVFKDKKKISERPRYINFIKSSILKIQEIQNFDNINKVIYYLINDIDIKNF